ncbi:MAG: type ISP restriction/modification enzyme, partial [Snowella sp.]
HLLKSDQFNQLTTTYEGEGDNQVSQVIYNDQLQRIYINPQKYFANIPKQIWEFKIGGYQVLEKWLKDRKKAERELSHEDIIHYQKIVVALQQTLKIMTEIDQLIPSFPIQ